MKDKLTSLLDYIGRTCDHVWEQENASSSTINFDVEDDEIVVHAETVAHEKCGKCGRERMAKIGHAKLSTKAEISEYTTYDNPFVIEEWQDADTE